MTRRDGMAAVIRLVILAALVPPGGPVAAQPREGPVASQQTASLDPARLPAFGPIAAADVLATLDSEARQTLEKKGLAILDPDADSPPGQVTGLVVFQKPLGRVYRLLSQSARQGEYQADVNSVELIELTPAGPIDEHVIKVMFVKLVYRLQYLLEPRQHIRWTLAHDFENSIEHVSGSWDLYAFEDDRTLGQFGTTVRVGPALPDWIQDQVTRGKVPNTLEATKKWIDSDGRFRR